MNRIKLVKQHDIKDCGAACLCMVADYYGKKYTIQQLRKITHTGQSGITMLDLVEGAAEIGLLAEAYELDLSEIKRYLANNKCPSVVHLKKNHFIVVYKANNNYVRIFDPARGKYRVSWSQFAELWSGYLVVFNLMPHTVINTETKRTESLFWKNVKHNLKAITSTIILSWILLCITLFSAFFFQMLIDFGGDFEHIYEHNSSNFIISFLNKISNNNINNLFYIMLVFFIIMAMTYYLRGKMVSLMSKKIDMSLMDEYINKLFGSILQDISSRMTGDYIARISDLVYVRSMVSNLLLSFIFNINVFVLSSILMYKMNVKLFIVSLFFLTLYMLVAILLKSPLKKTNYSIMSSNASMQSLFKELVQGIEMIKTNNLEDTVKKYFMSKYTDYENYIYKGNILGAASNSVSSFIEQVSNIIIIFVGFTFVGNNIISLGELLGCYMLLSLMSSSAKEFLNMQSGFQSGLVAIERLKDIQLMDNEKKDGMIRINKVESVLVDNIGFAYPNKEILFNGISLNIEKGKKIAILGKNGCGKSTFVKILMGIEKTNIGNILINGIKIEKIDIFSLREKISYVSQNNFLFAESIKYNITLGKESYTNDDIVLACKMSGLYDFICEMPMGLETYIDENGINLSAGQKQSIAIARALIRRPDLLILDEATSNMDSQREKIVIDNILTLEMSCILITHNQSILNKVDNIIYINNERIEKDEKIHRNYNDIVI